MERLAIFVDYSNLAGSLRKLQSVDIRDYEAFFRFIFEKAVSQRQSAIFPQSPIPVLLTRAGGSPVQ